MTMVAISCHSERSEESASPAEGTTGFLAPLGMTRSPPSRFGKGAGGLGLSHPPQSSRSSFLLFSTGTEASETISFST
jgi:hypothetical protein